MKHKLILLVALAIVQIHTNIGFAQRDPSKEILVFFSDGVQRESWHENGVATMRSAVKSENLKSALNKIGINEQLLEVANPRFQEADTLTIMSDGTRLIQANMTKLFRIRVPEGKSREELIEELNRLPEVLYAEANGIVAPSVAPNDIRYGQQWALQRIQAEAAWDIYTGSSNSIIAIIDGGVDVNHEDLNSKISGGDVGYGWGGHGIHVAGIAAASTNNNTIGIAGMDWKARIHPQRIDNVSDDVDIYNAVVDAVNFSPNVYVLNCSWGLADNNNNPGRNSNTVRQAFAYAYRANRTSVTTMGNHQITHHGLVQYPAGFANVIVVGATGSNDVVANYSVQGNHIDVSAPGESILSTYINGGYGSLSGTSMAAPHVSGIASLLKGYRPLLSNDDIEQIIRLSTDRVAGMNGQTFHPAYGTGRVNAANALTLVRDNHLRQWTALGGISQGASSLYKIVFMGAPNVASGTYFVERHEVRKTITFPEQFSQVIGVWGRGVGTTGCNQANPNFGEGFCEVISSTSNSVTLRTYVYQVYDIIGNFLGWYPITPANVTFAYSVLGTFSNGVCGYTENFANQNVTINKTVTSPCDINVQNVEVKSGATLILDAETSTKIPGGFKVEAGAGLKIQ